MPQKTLTKLDIEHFDFKWLHSLSAGEFLQWCRDVKLSQHHEWFMPQLVAQLQRWEPVLDDEGKVSIEATAQKNKFSTDPKQQVLVNFVRLSRSELLPKQIAQPQYAKLTPLILLAMRNQWGIKYEQWRGVKHLRHLLEPDLLEATNHDQQDIELWYGLGSQKLLEIRELGLMTKSGATKGQAKNPLTTWALTSIGTTELGGLPKLTQTILTQIWLAHPNNRHHNMILDLRDWDSMPEPLVTGEIFQKAPKQAPVVKPKTLAFDDAPWL